MLNKDAGGNDRNIYLTLSGAYKTYNDVPGPTSTTASGITSPAYLGSQRAGFTKYQFTASDCVTPDPTTRLDQPSDCVIWDNDSRLYPGYMVSFTIGLVCDLDDYVWVLLVVSCVAFIFLINSISPRCAHSK